MANIDYKQRELFHGNQLLTIGTLTAANTISDVFIGTGLVSVSAMEDDADIQNFAADDVADHATIAGASLLKGTLKFIQLDPDVRIKFFGQDTTASGAGYANSGVYPKRAVQYVTLGQTRDGNKAAMVTVYPSMSLTGKPTKSTETDSSDKPTAVNWEAKVQAGGSEYYTTKNGVKAPEFEYMFYGDDVDKVIADIKKGTIVTPNYKPTATVAAAGGPQ